MKIQFILLCSVAFLLSIKATRNGGDVLKAERIARHNEIRRELEREATPFLFEGLNLDIPLPKESVEKQAVRSKKLSAWEYLGDYSVIDIVAGLFSILSLVSGTIYLLWKLNPFLGKNIK